MKQVLVAGGAGFIGANLCKKLLDEGNLVICVDNFITSDKKNISEFSKNPRFIFIKHDIVKPLPDSLSTEYSLDEVYDLACPTGVPNIATLSEEMLLTCSLGTRNILELVRRHNAKLVLTSSSEVYGEPEIFPQIESYNGNVSTTGYRSPYEEGKRFAESLTVAYYSKYKIHAVIARVFNTYGPRMSQEETRVIPKFLRLAMTNEPLPVEGKGTQARTFCYVDDLVMGLTLLMKKGKAGQVYNLGSDKEASVKDLAKEIIKITGTRSRIRFVPRPVYDHNRRLPDLTKMRLLGWESKIGLEEGLRKTINGLYSSH